MIYSYYTSAAGLLAFEKGMDVTANNIANISTAGYKAAEPTFADLVYTNINAPASTASTLKMGNGTKLSNTDTVYTEGNMKETDRALDFALAAPDGFFAVQDGAAVRYTRNGNFQVSEENGAQYLTAADGGYVLDPQGGRIIVNNESAPLNIGVFTFRNLDGLVREGNTSFAPSAASGAAAAVDNPEIKNGYLEDSSVNLTDEMSQVIELQRAFQLNSKMVQMSDELMQTLNSMR